MLSHFQTQPQPGHHLATPDAARKSLECLTLVLEPLLEPVIASSGLKQQQSAQNVLKGKEQTFEIQAPIGQHPQKIEPLTSLPCRKRQRQALHLLDPDEAQDRLGLLS